MSFRKRAQNHDGNRFGTTAINLNKTDLNLMIQDVNTELKDIIEQKNASIIAGKLCAVKVVPFQFYQLLLNLIGNALKYSNPQIKSVITITSSIVQYSKMKIANLPRLKQYCHIVISDNGIGFEKQYSEKIFERFNGCTERKNMKAQVLASQQLKKSSRITME